MLSPVDFEIGQQNLKQAGVQGAGAPHADVKMASFHKGFDKAAETYRRLRMDAAVTDQTHQDILETVLADHLKRANAWLRKCANNHPSA